MENKGKLILNYIKSTADINYSGQKLDNLWLVGCCDLDKNGSYNLRNSSLQKCGNGKSNKL